MMTNARFRSRLASVSVAQIGFTASEEAPPVNAFGLGLSGDPAPHHK